MGVVGRLDQYASMLATEFDETTANNPSITGFGTYYASEFNENIVDIVRNGLVLNLDAGNLASYPGSGTTWTDVSGNGNTGTLVLGPTYNSENGGSIVFDGTNDKVTLTPGSQFAYGTGDFAVEGWFYCTTTLPSFGSTLFSQTVFGTNYFWVVAGIGNVINFTFGTSGGGTAILSSTSWNYNTWNHFTVSRISGSVIVYLNTVGGTPTACNQDFNNITYVPTIGQYTHDNNNGFGGRISALRVYRGKGLTATEVAQNYNALATRYGLATTNSTAPMLANVFAPYDLVYDEFGGTLFGAGQGRYMRQNTDKSVIVYNEIDEVTDFYGRGIIVRDGLVLDLDAGVSASYSGSGTAWTDLSGNSNTGTLTNGPTYNSANGGSLVFNGSNNFASIPSPSPLSGTQLFTFEIWVNLTSITGNFGGTNKAAWLFAGGTGGGGGQPEFAVLSANNTSFTPNIITFGRGGGGTTGSLNINVSSLMSNGNWYQISLVRSASNIETVYLNGFSIGTGNVSNSFSDGITNFASLENNINYSGYLNGKISNIKIYNRALSAAEVSQNFNALKGRFGL